MKTSGIAVALLATAVVLAGCARVKFYEDANLTNETGLEYSIAKPYLLVANTGAKDKPVEVSIVYLPDQTKKRYAKYKSGLGTHEFTLSLTNGMLASYGQKADSKVPETIQAMGSLASSLATAAKTAGLVPQGLDFAGRRAEAANLRTIATGLRGDVSRQPVKGALTGIQKTAAGEVAKRADAAAAILEQPNGDPKEAAKILREGVVAKLDALKVGGPPPPGPLVVYNGRIDRWKTEVRAVAEKIDPSAPPPAFTLYEIVQDGSGTRLVPVNVHGG